MTWKNTVAAALVAAATALPLAACTQTSEKPTAEPKPTSAAPLKHGPLLIRTEPGAIGMFRPKSAGPWIGNFAVPICLTKEARGSVRLTSATYDYGKGRGTTSTHIRSVKPGHVKNPPGFLTATGPLNKVIRPYGGAVTKVAGTSVALNCGKQPSAGYVELITSLRVGNEGLTITAVHLDYEFKGQAYRVDSELEYTACGTAQKPDDCDGVNNEA